MWVESSVADLAFRHQRSCRQWCHPYLRDPEDRVKASVFRIRASLPLEVASLATSGAADLGLGSWHHWLA